jgi:hypothetical protein
MTDYPHVQAAFINAIRDEGNKDEACDALQKEWNRACAIEAEIERLREALEGIEDAAKSFQDDEGYEVAAQVRIRARAALEVKP